MNEDLKNEISKEAREFTDKNFTNPDLKMYLIIESAMLAACIKTMETLIKKKKWWQL